MYLNVGLYKSQSRLYILQAKHVPLLFLGIHLKWGLLNQFPLFVDILGFFFQLKALFNCYISYPYLAGVNKAQLCWRLPNMNVI